MLFVSNQYFTDLEGSNIVSEDSKFTQDPVSSLDNRTGLLRTVGHHTTPVLAKVIGKLQIIRKRIENWEALNHFAMLFSLNSLMLNNAFTSLLLYLDKYSKINFIIFYFSSCFLTFYPLVLKRLQSNFY